MVPNKTRHLIVHCHLISSKGIYEQNIKLLGFSMLQVLYYTPLQDILTMSTSQVATCLTKVNTRVPMSIMQLKKITKLWKIEMSISLHQDIDELYDNITDRLLDDDMIGLYIISLFEIPVTGINRRLQCKDIQIKKYM